MRIGIDFDNTLIDYDHVFVEEARARGLISATARTADFNGSKQMVRDAIRRLPDGELAWQRLQGYVYGAGIGGARLYAEAGDFLRRCRAESIAVFIVSHKTRYGHHDPARVDLRQAALGWMAEQGFFRADGFGLKEAQVFFEDNREAKLKRIAWLGCTHFIDDLEEVFADPSFPKGVKRILFTQSAEGCCDIRCRTWLHIARVILDDGV